MGFSMMVVVDFSVVDLFPFATIAAMGGHPSLIAGRPFRAQRAHDEDLQALKGRPAPSIG